MESSRWTTIDRVLELEPGKGARALRNVPNTLDILDSHFPRFPVLPGVLSLGSLGDLSARLLKEQTGQRWRLVGAEQVRFRHYIRAGDQMELVVELKQISADTATLSGTIRVDGKVVTTARQIRLAPDDQAPEQ